MKRNLRLLAAVGTAVLAAICGGAVLVAAPPGDRTLALRNIHNDETLVVAYKKNGRYVPEAMKKINWIMRDWRRNEATTMDPALIDLIWEIRAQLGSSEPVNIISGYRAPATNEKMRRSGGGQAKNSRHMLGMAADIQFPDVPVRRLRYAALVRERGGVGYYPTSGTPFVHVDTGRVRAWPRLPRQELALLFPDAHTKHLPSSGGPITRADVREARTRNRDLAVEVAAFRESASGRRKPATQVAAVGGLPMLRLQRPARPVERRVAALTPPGPAGVPSLVSAPIRQRPVAAASSAPAVPVPHLVRLPQPADRPVRLAPRPSDDDRRRMMQLAVLASISPALDAPVATVAAAPVEREVGRKGGEITPHSVALPSLTGTPPPAMASPAPLPAAQAGNADNPRLAFVSRSAASQLGRAGTWASAPVWDADHPDESAYRPFPLAPFLTMSASIDDPALVQFVRPDFARMGELFDPEAAPAPLRLRPGRRVAKLIWAGEGQNSALPLSRLGTATRGPRAALALRQVRTEKP